GKISGMITSLVDIEQSKKLLPEDIQKMVTHYLQATMVKVNTPKQEPLIAPAQTTDITPISLGKESLAPKINAPKQEPLSIPAETTTTPKQTWREWFT